MKRNSRKFKIVSILTLFLFINSCTLMSLHEIPKEKIKDKTGDEYIYIVIHKSVKYRLNNTEINKGISGNIDYQRSEIEGVDKFNQVLIYLNNEFELQGANINIALENIQKIEVYRLDGKKTVIFIGGFILIVVGLIYVFFNSDMKMNTGSNNWY